MVRFFFIASLLAFWFSSAQLIKWLANHIADNNIKLLFYDLRFSALFAGLAIPFLLGLAAIGLDRLLDDKWPRWT